jgi:hypothetical protein
MALVGLVWMAFGAMQQVSQTSPTWSEAKRKISEGAVEQVTFEHNRVRLQLREKAKGQPVVESVERVTADDAGMVKLLEEKEIEKAAELKRRIMQEKQTRDKQLNEDKFRRKVEQKQTHTQEVALVKRL